MFKFCSLYSGSSGNCSFVQTDTTKILIDVGESTKKIVEALQLISIEPSSIDAILVTHEHSDHVKGLGLFSKKFNIPIYANKETWDAMPKQKEKVLEENIKYLKNHKVNQKIKIINCYEIVELNGNVSDILEENDKILNTSGEKEITEIFENYKSRNEKLEAI